MYGTIARMQVKPGKMEEFNRLGRETATRIPGMKFVHVYRTDADPNQVFMVVAFESREAYRRNAESPEMDKQYQAYRALLAADPEWHDGEIVSTWT